MKKLFSIIISVFLLAICTTMALPQERLHVSRVRFLDEYTTVDEELVATINLENDDLSKMKNLKATIVFPELGLRKRIGPFNLKKNREVSKRIYVYVPGDVEPGFYTARITFSNDNIRRVKHRWVYIGPKILKYT